MKLHLKEERPLIYLSGNGSSNINEKDLIDLGCKYRCFSYAYTCKGALYYTKRMDEALETCLENNVGVMMDSSAHSFHVLTNKGFRKAKGKYDISDISELKDKVIEHYVEYVKAKGKAWDFYVNFDYVQHYPTVFKVQKQLEKMGIRPIPVFHGDVNWMHFEDYCKEGYKLIGIGSKNKAKYDDKRRYFDYVSNIAEKYGVLLHGFAVTSLSLMFMYPFYSVDSATWAKTAAYGSILSVDLTRNSIGEIHVTDKVVGGKTKYTSLPKALQKHIRDDVEKSGFKFKEIQTDGRMRSLYNVQIFTKHVMELKEIVKSNRTRWRNLP